jgi:hypothetical protein
MHIDNGKLQFLKFILIQPTLCGKVHLRRWNLPVRPDGYSKVKVKIDTLGKIQCQTLRFWGCLSTRLVGLKKCQHLDASVKCGRLESAQQIVGYLRGTQRALFHVNCFGFDSFTKSQLPYAETFWIKGSWTCGVKHSFISWYQAHSFQRKC